MGKLAIIAAVVLGSVSAAHAEKWTLGVRGGALGTSDGDPGTSSVTTGFGFAAHYKPLELFDFEIALDRFASSSDSMDESNRTISAGIRLRPPTPGLLDWYLVGAIGTNKRTVDGFSSSSTTVADIGVGMERSFGLLVLGADLRLRSGAGDDSLMDLDNYEAQSLLGFAHASVKF